MQWEEKPMARTDAAEFETRNQDILIIAPAAVLRGDDKHPEEEGAQDIVIGNTNGILYHVGVETWKNTGNEVPFEQLPDIVQKMYENRTVLAYLPLPPAEGNPEELRGYYLANFAILNNEQPTTGPIKGPPGHVYRLPKSAWFDEQQPLNHMFWPGNSAFLIEILNKGSAMAYVTKAARTMDCFCYLLNLASLNGSDVFDPTTAAKPKCEVRTDGTKRSV
jgi:hypothetical protein